MRTVTFVLGSAVSVALFAVVACGAPQEPAKSASADGPNSSMSSKPAEPSSSSASTPTPKAESSSSSASTATPALAASSAAPAKAKSGPSKAALADANKFVLAQYPAPFAKTYAAVVAKVGEPQKKSDNMYQWYTLDEGKCFMFFMTKDNKKGHAASGLSDTDMSDCK